MSVVPVWRPFKLQAVSPCLIANTFVPPLSRFKRVVTRLESGGWPRFERRHPYYLGFRCLASGEVRDHQLVFDVTLPHGDDKKPTRLVIAMPEDARPQDMLCAIMRHPDAPLVMRLDAAKHAAVFMHARKSTRMKVVIDD